MVTGLLRRFWRGVGASGRIPQGIYDLRGLESERAKDARHSGERRREEKSQARPSRGPGIAWCWATHGVELGLRVL